MKTNTLLFLALILLISCSKNDEPEMSQMTDPVLISKGDLFGAGTEGIPQHNLSITTELAWSNLMLQMNSINDVTSSFTETDIDFDQYQIIAAFDSVKSSGGYSINMTVSEESDHIKVLVANNSPQGNVTTVITQPYHILKIEKSDLPVVFE